MRKACSALLTALIFNALSNVAISAEDIAKPVEIKNAFTLSHLDYADKAGPACLTIKTKPQWDELCQKASIKNPPAIDFEREMALVITSGQRPTTGYEIKIQQIFLQDKKIIAKYTVAEPIPDEPTEPITGTSFTGVVIEKQSDPAEFMRMENEIPVLVTNLGDNDWEKRESATKTLLEMGKVVIPSLIQAFNSKDPEVRMRARMILGSIVPNIMANQQSGWIGITMNEVPAADERLSAHIKEGVGTEVGSVIPGQPSEKFGLKEGDIIISLNNENLSTLDKFREQIHSTRPGTRVMLGVVRAGRKEDLPLVIGARPKEYQEGEGIKTEELWQEWSKKHLAPK